MQRYDFFANYTSIIIIYFINNKIIDIFLRLDYFSSIIHHKTKLVIRHYKIGHNDSKLSNVLKFPKEFRRRARCGTCLPLVYKKWGDEYKTPRHPEWSALNESVMVGYDKGMLYVRIFSFQVIASPLGKLRCGRTLCSGVCTDQMLNG